MPDPISFKLSLDAGNSEVVSWISDILVNSDNSGLLVEQANKIASRFYGHGGAGSLLRFNEAGLVIVFGDEWASVVSDALQKHKSFMPSSPVSSQIPLQRLIILLTWKG